MVENSWSCNGKIVEQRGDDDYSIIDRIYLYVKDLYKAKYQYREQFIPKSLEDQKTSLEYSITCRMFIKILKSTTQADNVMY